MLIPYSNIGELWWNSGFPWLIFHDAPSPHILWNFFLVGSRWDHRRWCARLFPHSFPMISLLVPYYRHMIAYRTIQNQLIQGIHGRCPGTGPDDSQMIWGSLNMGCAPKQRFTGEMNGNDELDITVETIWFWRFPLNIQIHVQVLFKIPKLMTKQKASNVVSTVYIYIVIVTFNCQQKYGIGSLRHWLSTIMGHMPIVPKLLTYMNIIYIHTLI